MRRTPAFGTLWHPISVLCVFGAVGAGACSENSDSGGATQDARGGTAGASVGGAAASEDGGNAAVGGGSSGGSGALGGASGTSGSAGAQGGSGMGGSSASGAECDAERPCPPGFYCSDLLQECGSHFSWCAAVPTNCAPAANSVCGCDGQLYDSKCAVHQAGLDVSGARARCEVPEGSYACGARLCRDDEACLNFYGDTEEDPGFQLCEPIPDECGAVPTCDCMAPCDVQISCSESSGRLRFECAPI